MGIVGRLDDMGRPAWIGAMIVGFVLFWPVGLAMLAFMIWSGRMGCMHNTYFAGDMGAMNSRREEMRNEWRARREEWREMKRRWKDERRGRWHFGHPAAQASGNSAFDEYKAETLKRLEEEQAEFQDFLDNLRKSRDKAEFDQFMSNRRGRTSIADANGDGDNAPAADA